MKKLFFVALCIVTTNSAFSSNLICPEANLLSPDKINELKSKGSITLAAHENQDPDTKQEVKHILMRIEPSKNVNNIPASYNSIELEDSSTRYDSDCIRCTYKYKTASGDHTFEVKGTKH